MRLCVSLWVIPIIIQERIGLARFGARNSRQRFGLQMGVFAVSLVLISMEIINEVSKTFSIYSGHVFIWLFGSYGF